MTPITTLKPNQVFVFGSNELGFHFAGAAGLACRGDGRNNWRKDLWARRAMSSPEGSPHRIGNWAVYGVARGFQKGTEGMSYAIATCTKPGARRSVPLTEIAYQIGEMHRFCDDHPEYEVLMTEIGTGYAGYSQEEMNDVMAACLLGYLNLTGRPKPINLVIPDDLYRSGL